jgi:pentapeptide MXKDX repeat protein
MSAEESRKVVSRAVMDEEFRNTLFSDPDKALVDYDLTPEEVTALRAIPTETIDDFANNLDERISMSLLAFGADLMGGDAFGGDAMGGDAMGGDAFGGDAMGGDAMGGDAMGGDAMGGDAMGGDALGGDALGGDAMGGDALGGDALGGDAMGAGVGGSAAAAQTGNWLARLAAALGIGGGGGGRHDLY